MPSDVDAAARRPAIIRSVPPDRPWAWLTAGWRDLMANPQIGFFYGGALTVAGWVLALLLIWARTAWAILPASAGFFMVAPAVLWKVRSTGSDARVGACSPG